MTMIKATTQQLSIISNSSQGGFWRVLVVCMTGMLRSPTCANVLHTDKNFNTRSCGADKQYALIPISEALIRWADEIVFVNQESFDVLGQEERLLIKQKGVFVTVLAIEDDFNYNSDELKSLFKFQYNYKSPENKGMYDEQI